MGQPVLLQNVAGSKVLLSATLVVGLSKSFTRPPVALSLLLFCFNFLIKIHFGKAHFVL